ncbi:MAG: RDD family protein [Actinomycetota bacterium]
MSRQQEQSRRGHYAGPLSRLVAFALDIGALWGIFVLATASINFALVLVTGHQFALQRTRWYLVVALAIWGFVYFAYQFALGGKTLGMALMGLRVASLDGADITRRQAILRTLCLPISLLPFGLGFLGLIFGRQRRGLHDLAASTTVLINWDAEVGRLTWLRGQSPSSNQAQQEGHA